MTKNEPSKGQTKQLHEDAATHGAAARDSVHETAAKVSSEMSGVAEKARSGVAQEVRDLAGALHTAAGELHDSSTQHRMIDSLADNLDHVSQSLDDKSLGDILGELNDIARRHPLMFLGSAALTGFVATRLATASASDNQRSESRRSDNPPVGDAGAATQDQASPSMPRATDPTRGENP